MSGRFRKIISTRRRASRTLEGLEPRRPLASDLVISEFMASNVSTLADENGEFSDWIELRNTTAAPINLAGWSLTDDASDLDRWVFPSQSLAAGGYLVVFASGKDRAVAGSQLHTNFKLSGTGEYLALVRPGGLTVEADFSPNFPEQLTDVSYGLSMSLSETGYFTTATPGTANVADPVPDATRQINITEIMYHPASESDAEEYIELHNKGNVAVNLAGWRFDSGVDFTFPAVTMNPGQYLVVASNLATFQAKYPGVANVIGSWNPNGTPEHLLAALNNSGEAIELVDTEGDTIDRVEYADQGDWGTRRRGPNSGGHEGWDWYAEHDGGEKSVELINLGLTNNSGQNWRTSLTTGGTPGTTNSVNSTNIAPLVLSASQFPIVPESTDTVYVTARLLDESVLGLTATVRWRLGTGAGAFTPATMFDDGAHGDGLAGDGVFGATLPTQNNGTVVEYYYQVSDGVNSPRTWPAPAFSRDLSTNLGQVTNLLYQVDDSFNPNAEWDPNSQPYYRIVLTTAEYDEFANINRGSDAEMNATWVAHTGTGFEVRHNSGVRIRGNSSRSFDPPPMRVEFPHDQRWEDKTQVNLNTKYTWSQIAGSAIFRHAGLAAAEGLPVQVRINGGNGGNWGPPPNGSYAQMQQIDSDFVDQQFPYDSGGNVYRKNRAGSPWNYVGDDPQANMNEGWIKQTNDSENDWTDLANFLLVMNTASGSDYFNEVNAVVDVDQWVSWFALMQLIDSRETNLSNGADDDYQMYRGLIDTRFKLLPHDLDTVMGQGDTPVGPTTNGIFQPTVQDGEYMPQLVPFFNDPIIVQRYYQALRYHIVGSSRVDLQACKLEYSIVSPK